MQLKTFRHLWGVTEPFESAFSKIKENGYNGVEFKSVRALEHVGFKKLLSKYDFEFIAQIHTYGETVTEHVASFKELIQQSLPLNPVLINSQSGKDSWTMSQKHEFLAQALAYEKEIGIPVAHETHRGRITYNPWDTRELLLSFAELNICCDFSHWVCVCERLIESEIEIIQLCAERCIHIHARVGYEQGPQVPDPRAPEYQQHVEAHEKWWDMIWQKQLAKGMRQSTIAPEFGPPGYHHTLPFSNTPVSNLWEICEWMNERQKERFKKVTNIF
ncbi:sugar phosphate isomerase/epimerase [Pedobacter petrophilus]|uniref:Sugar phosphate isomerase/epimerase n=2 Tax=Pedobacter TaxID=84567 RepID=A0A7K0FZN0_9SPHI|nr:sugar phosphate isomerase/epimerase [Pedobacter petrophilus]MRX76975.1 sugar phosphate isomerase/epimerase [Pedobacter petrophilus]